LYSASNVCLFAALTVAVATLFFPSVGESMKMFHALSTPMIFFRKLTFMSKKLFGENLTVCGGVFFYFLFAVFTFLFFCNLIGMIPYSVTVTSFLAVTLFFSSMGFFGALLIGLRANG